MTYDRDNSKSKETRVHEAYSQTGKKGGETRKQQLGHEGYVEMGHKGDEARKEQLARSGNANKNKKESKVLEPEEYEYDEE